MPTYHLRQPTTDDVLNHRSIHGSTTTLYTSKVTIAGRLIRIAKSNRLNSKQWVTKSRPSEKKNKKKEERSHEVLKDKCFTPPPKRRIDNLNRAKTKCVDLSYSNYKKYRTKFVTLTYAHEPTSTKQLYEDLDLMKKRYTEQTGQHIKYVCVIERGTQHTQRLHIHMLIFDMPYYKNETFQEVFWQQGFVKIVSTYNEGAGYYLAKYMTKDAETKEYYQRLYSCSKGLKGNILLYETDDFIPTLNLAKSREYFLEESKEYENPFTHAMTRYQTWIPPDIIEYFIKQKSPVVERQLRPKDLTPQAY